MAGNIFKSAHVRNTVITSRNCCEITLFNGINELTMYTEKDTRKAVLKPFDILIRQNSHTGLHVTTIRRLFRYLSWFICCITYEPVHSQRTTTRE